jgi:NAD+ kinase
MSNRIEKILVAYKRTTYERYMDSDNTSLRELIEKGDVSVTSLAESHDAHYRSLDAVLDHLDEVGIPYDAVYRGAVPAADGHDLILPVGGDGTVLDLSHKIGSQPMLAVNSDPRMSYGYFCAGTAEEFPELLHKTLEAEWDPTRLMRFGVRVNGELHDCAILNDILVAHENPAAVTSYVIRVGEAEDEAQKSSGIWISTAAGSTAAIRSAGGYVLPLDSHKIQYLVREPCPPTVGYYRHLKGIRETDARFEVVSKMPRGCIYLDGPHIMHPFGVGDVLTIDPDVPPLAIFGIEGKIRD